MSVRAAFGDAWRIYRASALRVLAVAAPVFAALNLVSDLIEDPTTALVFEFLVFAPVYGIVQAMVVTAAQDERAGRRRASGSDLLRRQRPVALGLALASLVATVGIAIGALAFVVPALFLVARWAVLVPVIVVERIPWRESFGRSNALVRGRSWPVFWTVFATIIVLFVPFAVPVYWLEDEFARWLLAVAGDCTVIPAFGAVAAALYQRLRAAS